mgnify:CR=1 FL=1
MGAIISGICVGFPVFLIVVCGLCDTDFFKRKENAFLGYTISVIIGIVFFIFTYCLVTNMINVDNQTFCARFEAKKETYERAINDERLTSLERIQITTSIMDINADLAEEQVSVSQWYNFNLSKENEEQTISLTPIK